MRARVIEMSAERGFGRAQLSSGELLGFDVSVSVLGVPVIGAELEVELGPARSGGLKITRAEIIPWWEATSVPSLCVGVDDGYADVLYLDRQPLRTSVPADAHVRVGTTGQLVVERKRGATNFFETRIARWTPAAIDAAITTRLAAAFRTLLVAAWEDWEDVDGDHTARALAAMRRDLFAGEDLGLDIEPLRTITDFAEQPEARYVHDPKAFTDRPEAPARTIRLTR